MNIIMLNPFTLWLKWYIQTTKLLFKERGKNLKIGYMSKFVNVTFGNYNTLYDNIAISNSKINDFVYVGSGSKISNTIIGKFCSIGPDVKIGLGKHPTHLISTFPVFFSTRKQCQIAFTDKNLYNESGTINIGNDVWIGANAIIMDDITIGDGAIVAANAVVTKNVAPYEIVGGIPARLIKKRFTEDEIENLLNFKWWEKEYPWLKQNCSLFNNPKQFFKEIEHLQ